MAFQAFFTSLLVVSLVVSLSHACTDILVTPGASTDRSAILAYNADSPTLFGFLYHYPASSNNNNNNNNNINTNVMRQIYDWDCGIHRGEIVEANDTYNVVGNSNEHGLVIGESTFKGLEMLIDPNGVMDYGSLIYITLQRAKTVLEAIHVMVTLMEEYGYGSSGESFSLADKTGAVWMMEVIGKGPNQKGAVWVAQRIPDGAVAAHANHARITTFPRDDPENCLYAKDVVDVAVLHGLYPSNADPLHFSFSDVYNPLDFMGARQGEARVWSIFSQLVDGFAEQYEQYALGLDLVSKRMPLYVIPSHKLSVLNVMDLMNSHYEDTVMDSSHDVGSGLFASPYRPRPLVWEHNGTMYHNERSIATAKTGWNFVAQIRTYVPGPLAALLWFACDDSSTSPRVPVYGSSTAVSQAYGGQGSQDGVRTPILHFDLSKAFWVQNMVSNFAYSRWSDVYPIVRNRIDEIHQEWVAKIKLVDERALKLYHSQGPAAAVRYVTLFSVNAGNNLHRVWMDFYGELFVRFRDYYTIVPKEGEPVCGCEALEPGMSETVQGRIVQETRDRYKIVTGGGDDKGSVY